PSQHFPHTLPSYFSFHDTPTTEIYTLSLHDALPISISGHRPSAPLCRSSPLSRAYSCCSPSPMSQACVRPACRVVSPGSRHSSGDRKSTRLNSSHRTISYAVFCLKKKKQQY